MPGWHAWGQPTNLLSTQHYHSDLRFVRKWHSPSPFGTGLSLALPSGTWSIYLFLKSSEVGSFLITQQHGVSPFGACPSSIQYLRCHCKAVGPLHPNHPKILSWLLEIRPALMQASVPDSLPSQLPVFVGKKAIGYSPDCAKQTLPSNQWEPSGYILVLSTLCGMF